MHKYKDLEVWKKSMNLCESVYQLTEQFPKEERYGLTSQMRRSAVSVPSNIAEGAGRNSPKEFNQFLGISLGSLFELETQLELSARLKLSKTELINSPLSEIEDIRRMIYGLQKSLK